MTGHEREINRRARALVDKLSATTARLDRIVAEMTTTTETSSTYWNRIQREVRGLYEDARRITANWANENIPVVYRNRIREVLTDMKNRKIPPPRTVNPTDFISTNRARQSLSALLAETNSSYMTGFLSGRNTMIRLARLTQQYRLREDQIERSIERGFQEGGPGVRGGIVGKGSLYGVKRSMIAELAKKATDGKYITVIDKNGKQQQWDIKAYAELVARTKMNEATTQATINAAADIGTDLVAISVHNTTCAVCAPYEGKVFSLSGEDPDFPPAEDLPPFHPRCLHSPYPMIKEAMQVDGSLQGYIDFSNGETDEHPTRTSFIPVSQRVQAYSADQPRDEHGRWTPGGGDKEEKRGHLSDKQYSYDEQKNIVKGDISGISDDEAGETVDAFSDFTTQYYSDIRKASIGSSEDQYFIDEANRIEKYIDKAPKYDGDVYRSIGLSNANKLSQGDEIDMRGISSWTSDVGTSELFAANARLRGDLAVTFKIKNSKNGVSIKHFSKRKQENEVLFSKKQAFKIKNINNINEMHLIIELEEI